MNEIELAIYKFNYRLERSQWIKHYLTLTPF